jgi:integrase
MPVGMSMRGTKFYHRRRLPSDVQRLTGKAEVWRSLRTDSLKVALRRLPSIAARVEAEIEHVRLGGGLPVDRTLIRPLADDRAERRAMIQSALVLDAEAPSSPTLAKAYQRYIDDPTRSWSASTREAYETCRKLAIAVIGGEVPIASICRAHCRDLLDVLRFLPSNAGKRFPRLSPREASDHARQRGGITTISAANANSLMSNMSSFLNWCVAEELLARNPARGLKLPDEVAKRDKRLPFSREQLRSIFNAPLYRGCRDGGRGYAKPGSERPRNARYWVPLIGLFTGARLGEICQLDTADIRLIDGVACIVVSQRSLTGTTDKRLKTGASDRVIPMHPTLIECGLLNLAEEKRRAGEAKLFDDIETGATGSRSVTFSKWFTQFLRSCGAQERLTCYHSFRHVFRDELRVARIEHDLAMLLGGWTSGPSRNGVSENYGSGHRVEALNEAICKLRFDCVDVRHLTWQ